MAEIRKDPLSDRYIIIAPQRLQRPDEYSRTPGRRAAGNCPFCAGHEDETPPATAVYPSSAAADSPSRTWQVRVVPNKYPAVEMSAVGDNSPGNTSPEFTRATGIHEVIIESSDHWESITDIRPEEAELVFLAYRDCLQRASNEPHLRYGIPFKNTGPLAGASLSHSHSQFIALPHVPRGAQREIEGAERYYREHDECFFCQLVRQELPHGPRLVAASPHFVAVAPFASCFAFETWILPRVHEANYAQTQPLQLQELSQFVCDVLRGLEKRLDRPDYNYWLHSCPFDTRSYDHYHWHIEIIPRLATLAGFEWGTGSFINPVLPEDAARSLRETVTLAGRAPKP